MVPYVWTCVRNFVSAYFVSSGLNDFNDFHCKTTSQVLHDKVWPLSSHLVLDRVIALELQVHYILLMVLSLNNNMTDRHRFSILPFNTILSFSFQEICIDIKCNVKRAEKIIDFALTSYNCCMYVLTKYQCNTCICLHF